MCALVVAACSAATAEVLLPAVPAWPLTALLTVLVAQVPLPARRPAEVPRTRRPARSELERHLERRVRGGEAD